MTWTDARIAQLTRLWASGVSATGIAEALGDVSRSAVLGKLHRMKQLRSRLPASEPRRFAGPLQTGAGAGVARPDAPPAAAERGTGRAGAPPQPPRSPWREAAFVPLRGTNPRPWLTRAAAECAFPVGGEGAALISCCAPAKPRSAYCAAHHRIVFRPAAPAAAAADQRAWARAADRWAA